jgi:hypothetical protein
MARVPIAQKPAVVDEADMDGADTNPRLQSIPKTARDLGLKDRQTYNLVQRGKIPSLRAGGVVRVPTAWVRDVLARLERGESVCL